MLIGKLHPSSPLPVAESQVYTPITRVPGPYRRSPARTRAPLKRQAWYGRPRPRLAALLLLTDSFTPHGPRTLYEFCLYQDSARTDTRTPQIVLSTAQPREVANLLDRRSYSHLGHLDLHISTCTSRAGTDISRSGFSGPQNRLNHRAENGPKHGDRFSVYTNCGAYPSLPQPARVGYNRARPSARARARPVRYARARARWSECREYRRNSYRGFGPKGTSHRGPTP
eukprot:COSAG02_NODE_2458_length_8805_cov_33.067884_1_plen_227_part_00